MGQIKMTFSYVQQQPWCCKQIKMMKERKIWTNEEDSVLKLLIEERGMTKWAQISDAMEKQFSIHGRNGKQCRQRYHNHLDKNISNDEWTQQEENKLFELQDTFGNKWALIASKLPGRQKQIQQRSDNCVKNHFYSKLRKGLRKVNKKIHKYLKREFKDIKTATLYRIIETMENRNKNSSNIDDQTIDLCRNIKNKLREYDNLTIDFEDQNDELNFIRPIIEDLAKFDKDIKKAVKKGSVRIMSKMSEEINEPKSKSNILSKSTKSMYDDDQSEYSNSDLFSSSSFDHMSLYSMRSNNSNSNHQLLIPQPNLSRSQSIQSQSEPQSDPEDAKLLYKSANSLLELKKNKSQQNLKQPNLLSNSLKLPTFGSSLKPQKMMDVEKLLIKKEESIVSSSSKSSKNNQNVKNVIFTYMMGQEQPFQMRLLTPKELTIEEKIQMHVEEDDIFAGQSMDIEGDSLVENFEGMCLNDMPKLGHSNDI